MRLVLAVQKADEPVRALLAVVAAVLSISSRVACVVGRPAKCINRIRLAVEAFTSHVPGRRIVAHSTTPVDGLKTVAGLVLIVVTDAALVAHRFLSLFQARVARIG